MNRSWLWGIALLCATTAGCGGGDTGSAPAPTPAATATPTPTASYPSPTDYTRDFSFSTALGYAIDQFIPDSPAGATTNVDATILPADQRVALTFIASPEGVRFDYAAAAVAFSGAQREAAGAQRQYRASVESFLILNPESGRTTSYLNKASYATVLGPETRNGVAGRRRTVRFGLVGPRTDPAEAFAANFLGYDGTSAAYSTGAAVAIGGRSSFSYTPSSDRLAGSLSFSETVGGAERQTLLVATITLDRATNSFAGTLTGGNGDVTGVIRGQLFGPAHRELAAVFRVTRASDGAIVVGDYIGTR